MENKEILLTPQQAFATLDETEVYAEIMKKVKTKILQEHKFAIYYSESENCWRTYLPTANGRKQIKRKSRENLENYIIEYYCKQKDDYKKLSLSLKDCYQKWLIYRRDYTQASTKTIKENMNDWNKFLEHDELANTPIVTINKKMLNDYFGQLLKDVTYTYKRITGLRSVLNGIFQYAMDEDIIQANPMAQINFKKFKYKPRNNNADNVYTIDDAVTLLTHLQTRKYTNTFDKVYALAIQLSFCVCIRNGELKGLRPTDIDFEKGFLYLNEQVVTDYILNDDLSFTPRQTVCLDRLKGTTEHGFRSFPLTDEMVTILQEALALNPNGVFLFEPNGKPLVTDTFNEKLKMFCRECNITYRSSHKIRFFTASLAYDGNNIATVSRMLGHADIETTFKYLRLINKTEQLNTATNRLGLSGIQTYSMN